MKLFLAIITVIFFLSPSPILNAQGTHHLKVYNKINKTNLIKSQVYLPDTLILYSMKDTIRMSGTYDQTGDFNSKLIEIWLNGKWTNYILNTWTYFPDGSSVNLQQNWLNGQWVNSTLDSSTYDSNGNMLVHLFSYWGQGAWKDSILSFRTYDSNGKILTDFGEYMTNGIWVNHDRSTYTNDGNGSALTFLFELWLNNQWTNSVYNTSTYDSKGKLLTETEQSWMNGKWTNSFQVFYTYDVNENMISYLGKTWDGQWTNTSLSTFTYDANGYKTNTLGQYWSTGQWVNANQYNYTNDQNGNVLNTLYQIWMNGAWSNYQQCTCTYDANGYELTGYNEAWSNSSWIPADNQFIVYINGNSYYFTGYGIKISYVLINPTDVSTDKSSIVKGYSLSQNYPNPFNPSTVIEYALPFESSVNVKFYTSLGQCIREVNENSRQPGNYTLIFESSGIASGVYFYSIKAVSSDGKNKFNSVKKMILLK